MKEGRDAKVSGVRSVVANGRVWPSSESGESGALMRQAGWHLGYCQPFLRFKKAPQNVEMRDHEKSRGEDVTAGETAFFNLLNISKMKALKIFVSIVLLFATLCLVWLQRNVVELAQAQFAAVQLESSNSAWIGYQTLRQLDLLPFLVVANVLLLLMIWGKDIVTAVKPKKEAAQKAAVGLAIVAIATMTGCMKPVRVDPIVDIQPNETAFVLPMEGENKETQKQFESLDYLEKSKLAAKRIVVPQRWRQTGRFDYEGEWISSVMVVKVNRAPVTREWTDGGKGQPITVESKDSIGFSIGVNMTGLIDEKDTSLFLYRNRNQELASVIDTNIRGEVQNILSKECGQRTLQECKEEKNQIFQIARDRIVDYAKFFGITVPSFGLAEGFTYEDAEIQKSITDAQVAEMKIIQERQNKEAQIQVNERLLSIARNEREQADEFAKAADARKKLVETEVEKMKAQAFLNFSEKWNGQVPQMLMTGGSGQLPFLMNLPAVPGAQPQR